MENNTDNTKVAQYAARAAEYLKKYGPSGTYTAINAPFGEALRQTIVNSNPFFGVYGKSEEAQKGMEIALAAYKPRKRTTKAGEIFKY